MTWSGDGDKPGTPWAGAGLLMSGLGPDTVSCEVVVILGLVPAC